MSSDNQKKLFVVDVSSFFFRAFYAVRPLSTASGLPTNATYGYLQMVVKLLKEEKPEYIAFCYDRKEPSFRKKIDPNYKANRDEMPEDLVPQMPYIKKVGPLLGISVFEKESFEADDLIGTFCKKGQKWSVKVVIVSGDKDFAQLINKDVVMCDTMKNHTYDEEGVVNKWGVKPSDFIDYLAIVGDASDNIPGVKGIGPKGAQKLITDYGSLDGIYKNLDKIKSDSVRKKLEDFRQQAYLSKELVTIVTDVELNVKLEDLKRKPVDQDKLKSFLKELEFQKLEKNLLQATSQMSSEKEGKKNKAKNADDEKGKLVERKLGEGELGEEKSEKKGDQQKWSQKRKKIKINKTSIKELGQKINSQGEYWVLYDENQLVISDEKDFFCVDESLEKIKNFLSKQTFFWKGFALKETWTQLEMEKPEAAWDNQIAAYVINSGAVGEVEKVFQQYTGEVFPETSDLIEKMLCQIELKKCLKKKLVEIKGMKIYEELDLKLIKVLYHIQRKGIKLDAKALEQFSKELEKEIDKIQKQIWKLAGEEFNVASPKQLSVILFEKLGLPPNKKTKTGYSTDTEVLNKLIHKHPVCKKILNFREDAKLKSTYVDALPQLVCSKTKRVHTTFNQALTTTGRLSSYNPNLQNIPIRTSKGHRVRSAFVADRGKRLLSVDYSQVELRILAHITGDKGLITAFEKDLDIHGATASEVFSVPLDEVTADLRRKAKAVNFGIAYGQGAFGLAENLGISRSEAKEIITHYFEKFPKVSLYMTDVVEKAKERGYVETLLGRRRYLTELQSNNGMIRKFGERAAINAPIQGTASDIIKKAMVELQGQTSCQMILQVHDELIFEGTLTELKKDQPLIEKVMSTCVKLKVPLKVNCSIGKDWAEAH